MLLFRFRTPRDTELPTFRSAGSDVRRALVSPRDPDRPSRRADPRWSCDHAGPATWPLYACTVRIGTGYGSLFSYTTSLSVPRVPTTVYRAECGSVGSRSGAARALVRERSGLGGVGRQHVGRSTDYAPFRALRAWAFYGLRSEQLGGDELGGDVLEQHYPYPVILDYGTWLLDVLAWSAVLLASRKSCCLSSNVATSAEADAARAASTAREASGGGAA